MKNERLKVIGYRLLVIVLLSPLTCHLSPLLAQERLNYPLDTVNGEEVYRYEIEKSIGLYRISVNFGVPQSEIIRLNPQIQEYGVRYGETLLIPVAQSRPKENAPVVIKTEVTETRQNINSDGVLVSVDTLPKADSLPQADTIVARGKTEIALLLPFESMQTKRSSNGDRMMEFYQGVLLALKQMQSDSARFRLRVYDTERSERRINLLCDSTVLDSVQAVMGVVYPIQIERMNAWCEAHKVPLLLPFSDDIDLATHPQVLQFNASEKQEADSLCQWILARDSDVHCVAIDMRESDISDPIRVLRKQLKDHAIPCSMMALRDLLNDSAAYALDSTKENLIILHSDKFQHVRILMPHLALLHRTGYRIRIVGQYAWEKENIGLPSVYTSVFTAHADREAYEAQWNTYFDTKHASDAPRFDLLGYDLTRALMAWFQGQNQIQGLQSDIRWQQIENGGYQNASVRVVESEK